MHKYLFEISLITAGVSIFLFSISIDLFRDGYPGIGFEQFSGMVIGLMLAMIALRFIKFPDHSAWDWVLFVIYLAGILFVGLRPNAVYGEREVILFGMNTISPRDFILNVAGFIPMGFLTALVLRFQKPYLRAGILVIGVGGLGLAISLLIETLQFFWVPGRHSSITDLSTNTLGALIGVLCYFVFRKYRTIYG